MDSTEQDWIDRMSKAKTNDEFIGLLRELPSEKPMTDDEAKITLEDRMTSQLDNSLVQIICPFDGVTVLEVLTQQEIARRAEHREQVRQVCVAEYSSNPLHQARAAKDPDYWKRFSVGRYNL